MNYKGCTNTRVIVESNLNSPLKKSGEQSEPKFTEISYGENSVQGSLERHMFFMSHSSGFLLPIGGGQ